MSAPERNSLVSIITPVLNGSKYIEICLNAVLNQTYPNIEQILVDGGSTDGTLEIIARYQARYPGRIKLVTGHDKGVGEAVNKGFQASRGQIIGWIDTDDVYEPYAVQTAVEFFLANPDASFLFGGCNIINEKGETTGGFPARDFDFQEALNDRHYVVFCASFYRRELIEKVGFLNTLGNDLDFWLRVARVYRLYRTDRLLANWRLHGDNISSSSDPAKVRTRKSRLKEDYLLCQQYGASIFSPRRCRYYRFVVLDRLHLYPLIYRIYPIVNKLLGRA